MFSSLGFNDKWRSWIKTCVIPDNLADLVNGSRDQYSNWGFNEGDPLAPFFFLLVVEGLCGLIYRVVDLHLLSGVRVGSSDLVVSHLQYEDDTIISTNAIVDDLWTIKAILHGFALASSLRVNYDKSSLIGVNFDKPFLDLACDFLYCKKESPPFTYFGISVGANPCLVSTWEPLVNLLYIRLLSCKHMYV